MAFEKPLVIQSFTAASAMTASTLQYTMVKLVSSESVVPCTSSADVPIGVLQNLPAQGAQAEVALLGITKIRVGATDVAGVSSAFIAPDASGRAILAVSGASATYVVGRIIQVDATDNDGALITAAVNFISLGLLRTW